MILNTPAGTLGYLMVTVAYLLLALVFLTGKRPDTRKFLLLAAIVSTSLWGGLLASSAQPEQLDAARALAEALRNLTWLGLLGWVLVAQVRKAHPDLLPRGLLIAIASLVLSAHLAEIWLNLSQPHGDLDLVVRLGLAILGLILVEQVYRNTEPSSRRAVKYHCIGIGGLFAFDFYLYADALMMQRIDPSLWDARGYVNAMIVPLIALGVARDPDWNQAIYVSRKVAFHSAALLGAGVYLLAMGLGGHYVREFGGSWGAVFQVVFLFAAVLLLGLLLFSGALRAQLRVLINKHFFHYKYDYRDEWLRFTTTLSSRHQADANQRCASAMAELIDSRGAVVFLAGDDGAYRPSAAVGCELPDGLAEPADSELSRFLARDHWVINLREYESEPDLYKGVMLPEWVWRIPQAWLITPLILGEDLLGFVVLLETPGSRHFNWEDCDLLKTAGRQAAAFLAEYLASQALTQSRQFEACNRLSTYVVHDLKNIIGQLSLLVSNAQRFGNKPGFWEDALRTVGFSVDKMNGLLLHLRSGAAEIGQREPVELCPLLHEVAAFMGSARPVPQVDCQAEHLRVLSERQRLIAVIGHLVRNAQEATPDDGRITLRLFRSAEVAVIEVQDTGCGMSREFIQTRLFRPFDTTKGEQGMGIGVFETREFITRQGGEVEVISREGEGTSFRLHLPLYDASHPADQATEKAPTLKERSA